MVDPTILVIGTVRADSAPTYNATVPRHHIAQGHSGLVPMLALAFAHVIARLIRYGRLARVKQSKAAVTQCGHTRVQGIGLARVCTGGSMACVCTQGMEEHNNYALDFFNATKVIKETCPYAKISYLRLAPPTHRRLPGV